MLYIKLFIEREKNTGQSAPECPFKSPFTLTLRCAHALCSETYSNCQRITHMQRNANCAVMPVCERNGVNGPFKH